MKDEILKSFVSTFVNQHGLEQISDDQAFERFVNFNIVSKLYPREIDLEYLSTGGGNDLALDGVAIIVNGNIIKSEEEIDFLRERNGTLDVTFALIQSKSSTKFKGEQIGNFIFGVKSFFDDNSSIPENENIQHLRSIKEKVYQYSIDFERLPELQLFFATAGTWKEPEQIVGKVKRELRELNDKSLFRNEAEVVFYDAERLKSSFREISRKTVKEILFQNHVTLPAMPEELNVTQSFIGSIPVKLYLDLITNDDGEMAKGLFYDNVRDFQGRNKVNKEIEETLRSSTNQALLALLNNGITIIAKKVERISTKLKLTDFQVVNGCQSTHVLFENKTLLSEDTHIVLKVIDTVDQEVTNKIIRATNRQTEVKDEAFESLKPFHKDLEEFYKAMSAEVSPPIYYERRSKEYLGNPRVQPSQVITLASQIKAYVSTVLEQPQSTHRYFGELLESNRERLFDPRGDFHEYYLSAMIINRLESLFRSQEILGKYRPFRYHVAYVSYNMIVNNQSQNNSLKSIILTAANKTKLKPILIESCKIIAQVLKEHPTSNRNAVRSRDFTKRIREKI